MKLLAHKYANRSSQIITIHEALRLKRKFPDEWEGRHFYDITKLRPMVPVDRGVRSSSFSFLGGGGGGHGQGSKGIAHELVQDYVCQLQAWPIKVYGKEFMLKIESALDEWLVSDSTTGANYLVDCKLTLAEDSDLYRESSGCVGIEITDTHKTTPKKRKALARTGLMVMELQMIPDWHVPNEVKITSDELKLLRARITGFLNKGTWLSCLAKPSSVRI